jgi:methylmalonyl-CoA/ethylmalonyl-CoA epimerase
LTSLDFLGSHARFHHVGLAVRSIGSIHPGAVIHADPIQGVKVSFLDWGGMTLELVEPDGAGSPVEKSLRSGAKLLHVCFEVPDLEAAIAAARSAGFSKLRDPVPAVAFGGRQIAWVYSAVYGLVELLEA